MMKRGSLRSSKRIIGLCVILLLPLISFGVKKYLTQIDNGKTIDTRLIGVWEGNEIDNQIVGMTKQWRMTRNDDGTFTLDFKTSFEGEKQEWIEDGTWWINNGLFHELHTSSGKTDVYEYKFMNENQVKFIASSLGIDHANMAYEFIDTKVK